MKITGFTPILDSIVREHGLYAGAIFGRLWRYQQGENKVSYASHATIAQDLNISISTVQRHIKTLIDAGLVSCIGKSEYGTNVYQADNDMVMSMALFGEGRSERPRGSVTETEGGRSERPTKKQVKKQVKNIPSFPSREWVGMLAKVTGMDMNVNGGRLARLGKVLFKAGYSLEDIEHCYGEDGLWYKHNWLGKQGKAPTDSQIRSTIKELTEYTEMTYEQQLREAGYH